VRRDEVLQYVQSLAEIRRDRSFDDGPVRLRHQAAHAGQLPDLRSGAAAPESAIMKMELNDFWRTLLPLMSVTSSVPSFSIMAFATWSFVRDQMSTTCCSVRRS